MRISNNVRNNFLKSVGWASLGLSGLWGLKVGIDYQTEYLKDNYNQVEKIKSEIKAKDYNRYVNCLEYLDEKQNIVHGSGAANIYYWEAQAKIMNDSLRIDSIAKSAYARGLQAAKDSIKTIK